MSSCSSAAAIRPTESSATSCAVRAARASIGPVKPATNIDELWANYVATDKGWTGGDSVYAYNVPGLGRLWTFADSYLGDIVDGERPAGTIHHSLFIVQGAAGFRAIGGENGQRQLIGPDFGPVLDLSLGGTVVSKSRFEELFTKRRRYGGASLDTAPVANVLATFSLPSLALVGEKQVGGDPTRITWGSFVTQLGGFSYVYGTSASGFDKQAFVARVAGRDLNAPWSYWDGHGWVAQASSAQSFLSGLGNVEYSVVSYEGVYVLLGTDDSEALSPVADVYFGCSPKGPFTNEHRFLVSPYTMHPGRTHWQDGSVYVYNEVMQPALPAPAGDLVLSYNQNALDFLAILAHPDIYRPGYLDMPIHLGTT